VTKHTKSKPKSKQNVKPK